MIFIIEGVVFSKVDSKSFPQKSASIVFSFFGIVEDGWEQADKVYEEWEEQWQKDEWEMMIQ